MTLGRTSSGAIKIKTDGTTRAVNCACCSSPCNCNPPLTVKYKFTATSFSPIIGEQSWSACGELIAQTESGHSIIAIRRCTNGTIPDWLDGWEIYALGGNDYDCSNLIAFVFNESPIGTHLLFGDGCYFSGNPCNCSDWTLTISEDAGE